MRQSSILLNLLGVVGLVGLLNGCGSGGDSGTSAPVAGSATPIVSSGTITNFGSVYINDRKYEIDDSTSTSVDGSAPVNGDVAAKNILKLGMVVKVSGMASGSSRRASTITQEDTVEGPIQSVDVPNSRFVVLGQTVLVDNTTKFDTGVNLGNLAANQVVEVSGLVKGDGVIAASFIERKVSVGCSLGCEIKGIVNNHNHATTTFQIGGLKVNYAAPALISDMPVPSGSNWNNLFVEVKGVVFNSGTSTLIATQVEPEGFQAPNGNRVELEGFVTSVLGAGHFMLGTTEVQAASALYLGGTIDEVAVGQKLEVEGTMSNNVITASKVKFKDAVRIESNVAADPIGNTLSLDGLPGIMISVNSQTEFKNVANLAGLATGNNVRIRGREGAGNTVIAVEVELRNTNSNIDIDLQGSVQVVSNPNLSILGVQVNTSGFTDPDDFQGLTDKPIGRAEFFTAVNFGALVKVKGRLTGGVVTWREAELED
jgi:hypothetical protein